VIGAVLGTRRAAALRVGADPVHAFVDGYHTGLLVTIVLLAAGVAVSYLTLRPRATATATTTATTTATATTAATTTTESAAAAELATVDELAGELMVTE
jgi:hypothetical protein